MLHEAVNVSTYTCVTLCFSFHQKTLLHVHGSVAKFQMKRGNLYGLFNVTMYSLGMGNKKINGIFSACQFKSAQVCSAMHRELLVHLNVGSQKLVSEIMQKIKICTYRYKLTFLQLSVLIYIDCITSLTTVLFYFKEHISALSQAFT